MGACEKGAACAAGGDPAALILRPCPRFATHDDGSVARVAHGRSSSPRGPRRSGHEHSEADNAKAHARD
jgi:hypothetical protein